jgi:hypothetical protein
MRDWLLNTGSLLMIGNTIKLRIARMGRGEASSFLIVIFLLTP